MPRVPHNRVATGNIARVAQGRRRKRGAVVALGTLALTSGVTVAVDATTENATNVSVGRLAIAMTAHDGFKLDSCSSGNSDYSDNTDSNSGPSANSSVQDIDNYSTVSGSNSTVTSNIDEQPNSNLDYIAIDDVSSTQTIDNYSNTSIDQNTVIDRYDNLDNIIENYSIIEINSNNFNDDMNRPRYPFGRVSDSDPELPNPFLSDLSPGEDLDGRRLTEYIVLNDGEYVLRPGFLSSYPRVTDFLEMSPMYRQAVIRLWETAQVVKDQAGEGNVHAEIHGIRYNDDPSNSEAENSDSGDDHSISYDDSSTFDDDSDNSDG